MMQCLAPIGHRANRVSMRALATNVSWHTAVATALPTVDTGFKPYGQRLKERLL